MRTKIVVLLVVACAVSYGYAADPFDTFKTRLQGSAVGVAQEYLDSFAKDLGGVMGGGAFHQAKPLGVPGFDVGVHVPAKNISDKNMIVKDADVSMLMIPMAQAEIGLPAKIDLLARYSSFSGATITGAGLRYGIIKGGLGIPSLSVQAVHTMLDVSTGDNRFKAATTGVAVVVSLSLPILTPYIGIGSDSTTVEPDATIPLPQAGMKGSATSLRLEGGINMSLVPFTYVQAGASIIDGETGYTLGLGIKF